MPPKKAQKMSLNAFLGDSALGSWADEMDSVPTGPSGNPEERSRLSDAPNRRDRDDYRSDRPPREDLPLPTAPPYTAFVGNLAFEVTESEMGDFFGAFSTKSIKIIKDREEKPKGFGYVEFTELEGLKNALSKSGSSLAGRTIRVSVAEPPKERAGPGGGFDDDAKFAGNWRRDGPLPDLPDSRDSTRRRFDSDRGPPPPGPSDNASDWRSASRPVSTRGLSGDSESRSKRTGFGGGETTPGAADTEETWSKGSKFRPSSATEDGPGNKFGGGFKRTDAPPEESDWRKASRPMSRNSTMSESAPPTPMRRKLELLPKSTSASTVVSPLSSPNTTTSASRSNPFGDAKPVDVTAKEAAVADRLEKDKDRLTHSMSRTNSRTPSERPSTRHMPPPADPPHTAAAPASSASSPVTSPRFSSATVRSTISFAAAAKKEAASHDGADATKESEGPKVEEVTQRVAEAQI